MVIAKTKSVNRGEGMAKGETTLENEAAQSTTALGPLVGLAREDFVGAVALLLRETASDPARTVRHMQSFGEDVVQILSGKSELAPDAKDKRFKDPAWQYNPFFRAGAQYYLAVQKGMRSWLEDLELDELERDRANFISQIIGPSTVSVNIVKILSDQGRYEQTRHRKIFVVPTGK